MKVATAARKVGSELILVPIVTLRVLQTTERKSQSASFFFKDQSAL